MGKDFKKGDAVWVIGSYNDVNVAYFQQAIVHSCGTKQMVLTCAETGEDLGRHFAPVVARANTYGTYRDMSVADAQAIALGMATFIREARILKLMVLIKRDIEHAGYETPYAKAMAKDLAAAVASVPETYHRAATLA